MARANRQDDNRARLSHSGGQCPQSTFGYEFDVNAKSWRLCKDVLVGVGALRAVVQPSLASGLIATLAHLATVWSPCSVASATGNLRNLFLYTEGMLTTVALINYRATFDRENEWRLTAARSVLRKWHELGHPGIGNDVLDLMDSWVLSGGIKGDAVKRRDPLSGPLTEIELLAFNEGAIEAYERGELSVGELCLCLLTSCSGRRPRQLVYLKLSDLKDDAQAGIETPASRLAVPRLKQSGGFRLHFKDVRLGPELALLIRQQRDGVIEGFSSIFKQEISEADRGHLPLFPDWEAVRTVADISELRPLLMTDRLHARTNVVNRALTAAVHSSRIQSERTGELLSVHSYRFRYTVGTRAAKEGCGTAVIAEILDHTDTQNVGVYTKSNPEHLDQIDEAVGHQLAPLAGAFRGRLVDHESEAERGNEPANRVRHKGMGMATCGYGGACAAYVPVPCYTCQHFQPWLDGPHQQVLDELLREKQRIFEETGDEVIASVNDRTILAVCEVIQRCERRRVELATERGE